MARGNSFQRVASAACTARGCLAVGFCVSLLVVAALAYPVPAPKTLTEVKLDAYEHKIKYVETERNRWKVWLRDGDAFYYANAPAKAQTTRLAMQQLSAHGINFEPQPSTWLSRSIDMELALLGVVAKIIAFLATLAAFYHYYYEINKKKHAYPIESYKPDPKEMVVAGLDKEKEALQLIVYFVRDPVAFKRTGLEPPRGVLLIGRPGTGKTSLAKWLAVTADCPFYCVSASSIVCRYVGEGAARIRALFAEARRNKPSIVFIDEIDAIAHERSSRDGGGDEIVLAFTEFLCQLDGVENANSGVVVVMATNRPRVLDRALIRPGRVDIMLEMGLPDFDARLRILQAHWAKCCAGAGIGPCVDLTRVAESTHGFSGAELMGVVHKAARSAVREGVKPPTIGHLLVAVEEASSPHSVVVAVEEEACVAAAQ
jgi:ATP-dependent Zn protease